MPSPSLVIHAGPAGIRMLAEGPPVEARPLDDLHQFHPRPGRAALLLLDETLLATASPDRLSQFSANCVIVALDEPSRQAAEQVDRLFLALPPQASASERAALLRAAALHAESLAAADRLARDRATAAADLASLSEIGGALMATVELDDLLETILREARRVTASDAGSLYLATDDALHFRLTQNDSLPGLAQPDLTLPIDRTSFAGHAAVTGETLRIDDAYALPADASYRFDRRFDVANGYRTGAVLTVPMQAPSGETIGVLQLLNPAAGRYTARDERLARALGGQAAVAIENQRLRHDIESLFEGFIRASVSAIDQRDPGTSGHSARVAELTCELARRVDRSVHGRFERTTFDRTALRELRYAALLHDFGKVFVPETIFAKERKLPCEREALVAARFDQAREVLETQLERERARYLLECGEAGFELFDKKLLQARDLEEERLQGFRAAIARANEPRVLPDAASQELAEIADHRLRGADGREIRLLEDTDVAYLSVPQGSLTAEERSAIQSHVLYTHRFLAQIPWTRDLARVDAIASAHHEKLDGSGYPEGLAGDEIPIEARMLTIADIFDALTAADRPYKKALPLEKALEILEDEAERGRVDAELFALFCATGAWRVLG